MIKILHIINGLERGGAEKMLFKFTEHSRNNDKIKNITLSLTKVGSLSDNSEIRNQDVIELDLKSLNVISAIRSINNIKKNHKIDIVQGWMYHGNLFAFIIQKIFFPKSKLYFNIRHALYNFKFENYRNIFSIKIGKLISRYVNKIIYNSQVSKNHHEKMGYSKNNGLIIRNGFIQLKEKKNINKTLAPWSIDKKTIVIGKIARFHKIKAYEVFLKACEVIDKEFDILVVCIGSGTGDENFKKLLNSFNFKNKPITLGEVFHPEVYLQDIDLLVNASFAESMPNIIGEAFLHGSFCIATDVGDTSLYFPDKEFLFDPGNHKMLSEKIKKYINLKFDEKDQLIFRSKNNLLLNYSLDKVCKNYYNIYGVN